MATAHRLRLIKAGLIMTILFELGLVATASAITTLTQGYLTSDNPPVGAIVSLQKDSSDYVSTTTPKNVSNILGVVVNQGSSLLSLSSDQANQIQVATTGIAQVLVSDINGSIQAG